MMQFMHTSCNSRGVFEKKECSNPGNNLNVLQLNGIYRLELAKFMPKLHHGALPKIFDNFFKNISNIHPYRTRFPDNQNYFTQRVCTNSGKKYFL